MRFFLFVIIVLGGCGSDAEVEAVEALDAGAVDAGASCDAGPQLCLRGELLVPCDP